jgi:hypothetical protein
MVDYREVTTPEWLPRIIAFDRELDSAWVCDQPAAAAEGFDAGPSEGAAAIYLRRDRSTVVVALDGDAIVGYIIADDDRTGRPGRGGARGRYMGVTDTATMKGLFDFLADKYGWVWGRITNPLIAVELPKFGCKPMDSPFLYSYRRP